MDSPFNPHPFLIVLILWLTVIFTGLGLFAPVNPTAIIIFLVCAHCPPPGRSS